MCTLSIALTRFHEPDLLLNATLQSIAAQRNVIADAHLLDQSYSGQTQNFCRRIGSEHIKFYYHVIEPKGCAHARNFAINLCGGDILLWTDPDVVLPPDWAACLCDVIVSRNCAVVGGKIIANWHGRPSWYMKTNIISDQYSLIDLGEGDVKTDRIVGGSMGINIRQMGKEAYFDENLGRKDGTLLGGVDAEFCERAIRSEFSVYYCGRATAEHQIIESKMTMKWLARKFYYSGLSRVLRGGWPSAMNKKRTATDYFVLGMFSPFYLAGYVTGMARELDGKRKSRVNPDYS